MTNKQLMTVVATGVMMMGSGRVVLAEDGNGGFKGVRAQLQEVKAKNKEARQQILENRCDATYSRIDAALKNYSIRKDNHLGFYQQALTRWQKLVELAESKGKDTTQIKKDLAEFGTMVTAAKTQYSGFVSTLEEAKKLDCGDSKGQFKGLIAESRAEMKILQEKVKDLKEFVKLHIRPDLSALKG